MIFGTMEWGLQLMMNGRWDGRSREFFGGWNAKNIYSWIVEISLTQTFRNHENIPRSMILCYVFSVHGVYPSFHQKMSWKDWTIDTGRGRTSHNRKKNREKHRRKKKHKCVYIYIRYVNFHLLPRFLCLNSNQKPSNAVGTCGSGSPGRRRVGISLVPCCHSPELGSSVRAGDIERGRSVGALAW